MLGKKISEMSAEDLQKENENLYRSIFNMGVTSVEAKLSAVQTELTSLKAEVESHSKIRATAAKLNLSAKGEELIAAKTPLVDALMSLADAKAEGQDQPQGDSVLKGVFVKTAPKVAGTGSNGTTPEFTSYDAARNYLTSEAGGKMSRRDAARHISENFPELVGGK